MTFTYTWRDVVLLAAVGLGVLTFGAMRVLIWFDERKGK